MPVYAVHILLLPGSANIQEEEERRETEVCARGERGERGLAMMELLLSLSPTNTRAEEGKEGGKGEEGRKGGRERGEGRGREGGGRGGGKKSHTSVSYHVTCYEIHEQLATKSNFQDTPLV